jgi:lipopolysaccharide export system permease protein
MGKLDRYIIRKYMATFFFVSLVMLLIAVVIDITEKLEQFIEKSVPMSDILLYYLTYIPHMFSVLAPLFLFIAVILFTSKLAGNSEIVAILGNGISYYRLLRPYAISALLLVVLMLALNHWMIPQLNKTRVGFLNTYIHHMVSNESGINRTINKTAHSETIASLQNFSFTSNEGFQFSLEHFEYNELTYQLRAQRIRWNEDREFWEIPSYEIWRKQGDNYLVTSGVSLDTVLGFDPSTFVRRLELKEMMRTDELSQFIRLEKVSGVKKVVFFEVELHNRTANAFAMLILTCIGVAFSTRKKRGGTGLNVAIGLALSALFILFLRFSTTFATNAELPPMVAVWIPNLFFGLLSVWLIRLAPK